MRGQVWPDKHCLPAPRQITMLPNCLYFMCITFLYFHRFKVYIFSCTSSPTPTLGGGGDSLPHYDFRSLDHDDSKFFSMMEWLMVLSKYHCYRWFFNGFSHRNHRYQWFFNGFLTIQPLPLNEWYCSSPLA